MSVDISPNNISFLKAGGEMGELMRAKDWSKTTLNNPETWPQSLRTTLSIILNSKFPMFLFWGADLICFYNDAYRPSLGNGGKHPGMLGGKAKDYWEEIWGNIKPLIDIVLAGGEVDMSEDQLLPIYRNGKMEDVYWTFSYSAVIDETDMVAGVFVACSETSKKVLALKTLHEREEELEFTIDAAELACWNLYPSTNTFTANNRLKEWFGFNNEDEFNVDDALARIDDEERQKVIDAMGAALDPEKRADFNIIHSINNPITKEKRIIQAKGRVLFDENNVAVSFTGTGQDITNDFVASKKLKESEEQFHTLADNILLFAWMADAEGNRYWFNQRWYNYTGTTEHDMKTLGWQIVHHPDHIERVKEKFQHSLHTGEIWEDTFPLKDKEGNYKWFLSRAVPIKNKEGKIERWLGSNTDITELKISEDKIVESEKRFRMLADDAPMWVWLTDKDVNVLYANKEVLKFVGIDHFSNFTGKVWENIVHPDDLELVYKQYGEAALKQQSFNFECRVKNAVKNVYEWIFLNIAVRSELNEFAGFIGTAINIEEKKVAFQMLEYNKALLESFNEANLDGVLLVDVKGKIISYNKRFIEIWKMPKHITDAKDDEAALKHAMDQLINPGQFIEKVKYLYDHPTETSKDELEYKDGKIVERYGYPVVGEDGTYYALSWIFRDITQQKNDEKIIKESEERFRVMAETLPQLIWVTDAEGNREYTSCRWEEYTGIKKEDNNTWANTVHPEDLDEINYKWAQSLQIGVVYKHEVRLKNKQGEYRWFAVRGEPVLNNENEIVKWVGAFTDIHSQKSFLQELEKQVENRTKELATLNISLLNKNTSLRTSEGFNRALTEVSPNVVYILDLEKNKPVFLNKTVLDILGYRWEEIIKKDDLLKTIIHPADVFSVKKALYEMKTSKEGEVIEHEYRIKNKHGVWVPYLVRETAFKRNNKNEVFEVLGIGVDITEIKKSKDVLEQKNSELEKMNKELQSFAYISSHDLQEPLRKIQTFTHYIVESELKNLSDKGKDYFTRIQNSASRMRQLIDDLLSYSRASDKNNQFEKINLNIFIEEVKADFIDDINFKNAIIEIKAPCNALIIPFQFRQLIVNLISNALKFTKENVAPHIIITSDTENGSKLIYETMDENKSYCHIKMTDNGIGFEPRHKDKIFEVFQRLHGRADFVGTGIGLAIVKKIVDNHQGIIFASGELDKGAIFDIYLPQ